MALSRVLFALFIASLATIWTVWPRQYQRWVDGLFLGWGPAAHAAKTRVRSVFPFSLTKKPWYPTYLRVVGVLMWLVLLGMAYALHRS
jgi:hypothetical protein